jgi:alcohol dehydrogenase (NADP+)
VSKKLGLLTSVAGWGPTIYPVIVGHEIVGRVTRTGSKVQTFKVGDRAGVGAQVFACLECRACKSEQSVSSYR